MRDLGDHVFEEYPFDILDIASLLGLTIRRELSDSVYVDCPFCQRRIGKMNLNFRKNVWRCNRCGESGHMFELYARTHGIPVAEAKLEIIDAVGESKAAGPSEPCRTRPVREGKKVEQSPRASDEEIDRAMRALLDMLTLTESNRKHLREKRGLTDEQIDSLGWKSTASYRLRHAIPQKLLEQGCTIAGVPGFYMDKNGKWTVHFTSWTAGILIPVHGVNGLIRGAQIRLDEPIKDKSDPKDEGTKYLWFSTASKHLGTSSGSPVNFIGDPHARTVYVTEGCLKAGVAHCLMDRTFLSIQGATNLGGLAEELERLQRNGTRLVIEAHDMDKFTNPAVAAGASKLRLLARSCGLECRSLTWNPNYKGIDDWQLALKQKREKAREADKMNFKEQYLYGLCAFSHIQECVEAWHDGAGHGMELPNYLGLTADEYAAYVESDQALKKLLDRQRCVQRFRIYQLELKPEAAPVAFAFQGLEAWRNAGYQQPPAAQYRLMYDGMLWMPVARTKEQRLERIFERFNDVLPAGYHGRSVSVSDVLELYEEDASVREYFYCEPVGFSPVRFSPALALPMEDA